MPRDERDVVVVALVTGPVVFAQQRALGGERFREVWAFLAARVGPAQETWADMGEGSIDADPVATQIREQDTKVCP